jgi:hypothetical protein
MKVGTEEVKEEEMEKEKVKKRIRASFHHNPLQKVQETYFLVSM